MSKHNQIQQGKSVGTTYYNTILPKARYMCTHRTLHFPSTQITGPIVPASGILECEAAADVTVQKQNNGEGCSIFAYLVHSWSKKRQGKGPRPPPTPLLRHTARFDGGGQPLEKNEEKMD
jgi:hypothetical protein